MVRGLLLLSVLAVLVIFAQPVISKFIKKCGSDVKLSENMDVLTNVRLPAIEEQLSKIAAAMEKRK